MPKVILDTNVIVSSLVFGGKIAKIIDLILDGKIEMVTCEELEKESLRILVAKFGVSFEILTKTQEIFEIATKYKLKKPYPKISRDENDNYLLGLIIASGASILVSGDKDLLVLNNFDNTKILKPSEFLEFI